MAAVAEDYKSVCLITDRNPTEPKLRGRLQVPGSRSRVLLPLLTAVALVFGIAWTSGIPALAATTAKVSASTSVNAAPRGELDCNGFSPVQKPLRRRAECTDIVVSWVSDNSNTWGGRFYDNGHYIGHDEPDTTYHSKRPALATT